MLGVWILSTLGRIRMALEAYACAKRNSDGGGNMYIATMNKLRQQTFREIVEERDTMQRQGAHLLVPSMTLPCKLQSTSETVATLRQRRNNNITSNNNSSIATAQRQQNTRDQQHQYQSSPRSNGGESTTAARGHSRELSLFSSASSTASGAGGPAGAVADVPIGSSASNNKFHHQPHTSNGGGGGCSAASAPGVHRIIRLFGSVLAPMSALLLGRPPANHATAPSSPLATSINQPPSRLRRINSAATQFGGAETTTAGSTVRGDDEEDDADSVTTHYFAGPVVNSAGKGGRSSENSKPLFTSRPRSSGGSTGGGGGGGGGSTLMPATSAFASAAPAAHESVNNSTVVMSVFVEHDKVLAGAAIRFFQQPGSPSGGAATLRSISVNREELPATSRTKRTTTAQQQAPLMTTASSTASAINRLPRELSSEEDNILVANTLGRFGGAAVHSAGPPSRYLLPAALGIQTDQQPQSATHTTATAAAASSATTANETKHKLLRPPPLEPFTRPSQQHNTTTTGGAFEPSSVLFGSTESANRGGGGARATSVPTPSSHLLPSLRVHVLLTSRKLLEEELLYNATMFRRDQPSLFLTGHGAPQPGLGSSSSASGRGMTTSNRVSRGAASHITVVHRNAAAAASSSPNHNEGDPSSPMRICRRDGAVRGGRCRCRLRGFQLEQPPQRHHTTTPTTIERDDSNPIFAATPLSPYDAGTSSFIAAASNPRTASQQHLRHTTVAAAPQSRYHVPVGEQASSGDFGPCTSSGTYDQHNSSESTTYLEALRVAFTEEEWTEVSNVTANATAAGAEDNSCVRAFLIMEQNGSGCGAGGCSGAAAAASASAIFSPSTTSRMRRHWTAEEGGGGHPPPAQPTEFTSATFRSTTTTAGPTFLDEPPGAEDSMMQFHRGGVHTTRSGGGGTAAPPRETPLTPHPLSDQQQLFSGTYSSSVFSPTGGPAGVAPNNNINSTGSGNYYNNAASCSFIAELQFQRVTTATPNVIVVNAANAERCASGGGDSVVLRGTQTPTSTTTTMLPQQQVHTPPPERIHFPGSAQKVSKTTVSFAGGLASTTADDTVVGNATADEAIFHLEPYPSSSNNMPINSSGSLSLLRRDALAATLAGDDDDDVVLLRNAAPTITDKEAPSGNDGCGETRKESELIFSTPTSTIFPREITFEFRDDIDRRGGEENSQQQQDRHRPLQGDVPRTSTPPATTTHHDDDATVVSSAVVRSPTQRSLTASTRSQLQPPSPPPPIDEELPELPSLFPSNVTDAAAPFPPPSAAVVPVATPTKATKAPLPQLRLSSMPPPAVDTVDRTQHVEREFNNAIGILAAAVVPHLLIASTASATSASSSSAVVLEQINATTVPTAAADANSSVTIQSLHTADVEPSFSYCRVGHRVYRVEPIFAVHEEAEEEEDNNNGSEEQYAAASNFSPANGNEGRPALSRRRGGSAADLIEMSELQPAAAQQLQQQQQHPLCMICFHRPSTVILLPCQHFGFCVFCVRRLRHCPVCRQQIDHTLFLLEDVV
ncbi:zinc finger protein, putative [Bodo saltans]|uniref:Zinc finger protein, putative n=1 Tax=Bodo saltans TaxID=75058 RepID=A0A0S4IN98_BODSA|nr:zinc finger protein, putative [Bodo saltans]|eukprot:CUE83633.1 zinc finger protein, putative [Bodo saltans]